MTVCEECSYNNCIHCSNIFKPGCCQHDCRGTGRLNPGDPGPATTTPTTKARQEELRQVGWASVDALHQAYVDEMKTAAAYRALLELLEKQGQVSEDILCLIQRTLWPPVVVSAEEVTFE